jgi:hypothetical protein
LAVIEFFWMGVGIGVGIAALPMSIWFVVASLAAAGEWLGRIRPVRPLPPLDEQIAIEALRNAAKEQAKQGRNQNLRVAS